jgi:hypothetical protein
VARLACCFRSGIKPGCRDTGDRSEFKKKNRTELRTEKPYLYIPVFNIIFSIQVHTSHIPHTYRNVHISRSIGLCVLSAFHACRYTAHDRSLSRHRRQLSPVPMLVACAARSRRYSPPEQRHDQCIRAPPINTHHLPKRTPSGPAIAAAAIGDSPPRPAVQSINTHTKTTTTAQAQDGRIPQQLLLLPRPD